MMRPYVNLIGEIEQCITTVENKLNDITVVNDRKMTDENLIRIYRVLCEMRMYIYHDALGPNK